MDKQKLFEELLKKRGIRAPGGAGCVGPVLQKREDPGPYPLSFAQQRTWFLQQFDPGSAAYNDPTALRIKGPLHIPVLESALNEIIRRHRVLQMNFPAKEGQPIQVFQEISHLPIAVFDLAKDTGVDVDVDVEEQIRDFVNRFARRPFDLSGALIRAGLLRIAADDYALVVSIHHIVLDGWSKGIMLKELIALYEAFVREKPSPLEELSLQYTDYVHWLHEWLQGRVYETQSAYWQTALAGSPAMLELPLDHPRPHVPSGQGSLHPFQIPGDKLRALNALARRENVTLFMLFMAVYNMLLFRYSGQEDIPVGVPVAGRHRVELESLIGLFVN
ncbi:MAG TPA: condensation domain-containing protein, partial [Candidatus Deferrimicrobium sp.]|nr:condensation domain-containing protein [Candidatus Deferrimicrobium sp.]